MIGPNPQIAGLGPADFLTPGSNRSHGEVYLIQLYVIKFVRDFLRVTLTFVSTTHCRTKYIILVKIVYIVHQDAHY
jgi:hypothetical protein